MAKYISLDAVLAEIEKRISRNKERKEWEDIPEKRHQLIIEGQLLGELKHFLDSLEVKEVDLVKEAERFVQTKEFIENKESPVILIARHFLERGLALQKEK